MKNSKEKISELKAQLQTFERDLKKEMSKNRELSVISILDGKIKKTLEQVGILESEERAIQREPLIEKVVSILGELQAKLLSQSDQWDRLRKLHTLVDNIEKFIGVRKEWRRVDQVKVRILDEAWRQRRLPSISGTVRFPQLRGTAFDAGYSPDPHSEKSDIYEFLQFEKAKKFESEGRVIIIDEASPQYQEQNIIDPSPEILNIVNSLDFGQPVPSSDGIFLSEFEKARKELGGFLRINFECMHQLVSSEKQIGKKK